MSHVVAYHRPENLDEALRLLGRADTATVVLAGGTSVNADRSCDTVEAVDLQALGLEGITSLGPARVRIGAMARLQDVAEHPLVPALLRDLARRRQLVRRPPSRPPAARPPATRCGRGWPQRPSSLRTPPPASVVEPSRMSRLHLRSYEVTDGRDGNRFGRTQRTVGPIAHCRIGTLDKPPQSWIRRLARDRAAYKVQRGRAKHVQALSERLD